MMIDGRHVGSRMARRSLPAVLIAVAAVEDLRVARRSRILWPLVKLSFSWYARLGDSQKPSRWSKARLRDPFEDVALGVGLVILPKSKVSQLLGKESQQKSPGYHPSVGTRDRNATQNADVLFESQQQVFVTCRCRHRSLV